ncbi:sensor histidine kinase [Paenibacillus athensensis]|uniref:HAMP domain-containing protein n=1 Tax=Paenibacillus athensensis TaxID=1967502 RepID=A0A4Y8PY34_9BACL|nr:sensor histidine kinase [Paenibacillus athensensis]MCD1259646.1 sensor histidine kinase [Paenibacillus athensensis]
MKRISIRLRLMLLMIGLTTLPVLTVTWIATGNTRASVEQETVNANYSRMLWADQYLGELIQQLDSLFYSLQINESLMTAVNQIDTPDIGTQFSTQNYIRGTLTSAFHANSRKIDELNLYVHPTTRMFSVSYSNSGSITSLQIAKGNWSRMLSGPIHLYFKQSGSAIYAYHSMNQFEDRRLLGGISAQINPKVWREIGSILKSEPSSSVYVLNDEGELLSGSTEPERSAALQAALREMAAGDDDIHYRKTEDQLMFLKTIGDGQLTLLKTIPLGTVAASARPTIRAGIVTGSLFALASILLSILFSLRISRPIVKLARLMKTTRVTQFQLQEVQSTDEIGLLESGYNSMMQRIKELIEVEYQQEIDLKNAQLQALQAQINPHFLNNTLHMIGGMALVKDAPEIYRITRVIGELLRYAISTDEELVPLERELQHTRNYLFIQEQRFLGRCTIEVKVQPEALAARLPRFTLQPLVENAFEHGLQRKEGKWRLTVSVSRVGDRALLWMCDDGVGMEAGRLQQLRLALRHTGFGRADTGPPGSRRSIGLQNVHARLRLHYGRRSGIRLFSSLGAGTAVAAVIPMTETKEEPHV